MSREVPDRLRAGAAWERAEAERRRGGPPVRGTFTFSLPAGTDTLEAGRHLSGSVARARSAYLAGQVHPPTAAIIDVLQRIADEAVIGLQPAVNVDLDRFGSERVHGVLEAASERAGDASGGVRKAVEAILRQWDAFARIGRPVASTMDDEAWEPLGA